VRSRYIAAAHAREWQEEHGGRERGHQVDDTGESIIIRRGVSRCVQERSFVNRSPLVNSEAARDSGRDSGREPETLAERQDAVGESGRSRRSIEY